MKIQNTIRISAIVIGLGAALMWTSSVRAQEIENTVWNDGPNTAPMSQPVQATTADASNSAMTASAAINPAATTTTAVAPQEASLVQQSGEIVWFLSLGLVCLALIAVTGLRKAKPSSGTRGNNLRGTSSTRLNTAA